MRFCSLGSGSRGNAWIVEAGGTRVMVDCGFGVQETGRRLANAGLAPEDISAIVVTHEHSDHVGGVARFALRHGTPVWMTAGTFSLFSAVSDEIPEVQLFAIDAPFAVGDVGIDPFPVPHDAREPAQFVFDDGDVRVAILTDAGRVTAHMAEKLTGLAAFVLECNHDAGMLRRGPYPPALKARIASGFGHLENGEAAALLGRVDCARLRHVVAAHLSETNNDPALARAALAGALGCETDWIAVADQDQGLPWREL